MIGEPGDLRYRVIIEAPTDALGSTGEHVRTWATLTTVWAGVRPATAREQERAGQVGTQIDHIVTMRPLSTLTQQHRIVWRGRYLDIVGITYDPRDNWMQIDAAEQVE